MAKSYSECGRDVIDVAKKVLDAYHPDLREAEVTFAYYFAFSTNGPAVRLHGYPCQATVKVNSLKDRVEGKADCTLTLDGEHWDTLKAREREALLAHELYHVTVKRDRAQQP